MSRSSNPTVALVQTAIGDYRETFLDILADRLGGRLSIYAGSEYFDSSTKTQVRPEHRVRPLRNHFLLARRLLWQTGAVHAALDVEVAVLEFNPRILSVWTTLVLRRVLSRPSLLWGHAWSRSGPHSASEPLRRLMRRLAGGVIVYTEADARELAGSDPRTRTFVAPNALYRAADMQPTQPLSRPNSFIYVGRLVTPKKPDVLLQAFVYASESLPADTRLLFVGEGPMAAELRERVVGSRLASRVEFHGHVSDYETLRRLYAGAVASVSPGFVGLSITQSLGFGVPMIIARDEPHSPEFVVAKAGWNAVVYAPSTAATLADTLIAVAQDRETWIARRDEISADCRSRFSAEAMADGFIAALEQVMLS